MGVLAAIQADHSTWVDRKYPGQRPEVPAAGMVEEAGELLHALLKLEQTRIWGEDPRYGDLAADLEDAIGDCAIYMVSYCNAMQRLWDCKLEVYRPPAGSPLTLAVELVGAAVGHYKSRADSLFRRYECLLCTIATRTDVDFETAVLNTWHRVKLR